MDAAKPTGLSEENKSANIDLCEAIGLALWNSFRGSDRSTVERAWHEVGVSLNRHLEGLE